MNVQKSHVSTFMFQLEDVATDTERLRAIPQPVIQESSHPYTRKDFTATWLLIGYNFDKCHLIVNSNGI